MQQVTDRLSQEFLSKGWPELRIGIGLNSGQMRVGDMGSNIRRAYTVMGDEVNLGSRLEGLTKIYGVGILIGENTRNLLPGWLCREVDSVRVKGKNTPIAIFEPLSPEGDASDELVQELLDWQQALTAYRAQQWSLAQTLLTRSFPEIAPGNLPAELRSLSHASAPTSGEVAPGLNARRSSPSLFRRAPASG
jgi:adenylate cyclase